MIENIEINTNQTHQIRIKSFVCLFNIKKKKTLQY